MDMAVKEYSERDESKRYSRLEGVREEKRLSFEFFSSVDSR